MIAVLFDGTNSNVLYDMCARGEAPNVARMIEMGTAFGHGAMAVAAHGHAREPHVDHHRPRTPATTAYSTNVVRPCRRSGEQVITNSQATWHWSLNHLKPGIESIHGCWSAAHLAWDDGFTASVNEPCDKGADFSTFDFFRRGEVPPIPKDPFGLPHTTERFVRPSKDYSWSSVVDHMGIDQALGIIAGNYRDVSYPIPRFLWCNFTLTDSAMHEGGPHSEMAASSVRDSDGRVGAILDAVEQRGVFDDTAFVLMADHGMEETDPTCRGDWDVALREAGVQARDEAYSFLYLGV